MRYSDNYNLKLPQRGVDRANVDDLDDNFGIIDGALADDRQIGLLMYDSTATYNTGAIRGYENPTTHRIRAYRCLEDNVTGPWDATKWAQTTLAAEIEAGGGGGGSSTLAGLSDVDIGTPADGEVLTYDATEGKWVNAEGGGGGASELSDLDDVSLTTPTEGQILTYDGDDWVNTDAPDVDVTKTASGNPIEISDGANAPLVKCVSAITGSQDLHGQDKPWVGGAGSNKWDEEWELGSISPSDGTDQPSSTNIRSKNYIPVTANDSYCLVITGNITVAFRYYDSSKGFVGSGSRSGTGTFTAPSDASYMRFVVFADYGTTYNNDIAINYPATVTTYSPYSNICPITAYTEGEIEVRGKNLFDKNATDKATGYYLNYNTGGVNPSAAWGISGYIKCEPNTTYTISGQVSLAPSNYEVCFYDETKTFISGINQNDMSFTTPNNDDVYYLRFDYKIVDIDGIQLESGSIATPYEPYTSTTHSTTFPSAIFRGSEDVVNGKLYPDDTDGLWYAKDLGDLTWSYDSSVNSMTTVISDIEHPATEQTQPNMILSMCPAIPSDNRTATTGIRAYIFSPPNPEPRLFIRDTGYTDPAAFKIAVTGQKIAYKVDNPTTASVTPTNLPIKSLSGYSHIESSTGDLEVEYIVGKYQPLVDLIESSGGDSQHHYSTDEQVVGTWIDGSVIYEKTIVTPSISSTLVDIDLGFAIGMGFVVHGYYLLNDTNGSMLSANQYLTPNNFVWTHIELNTHMLRCALYGYTGVGYITIRYTKTTARSLSKGTTETEKTSLEPISEPLETKTDNLSKDETELKEEDESKEIEEVTEEPEVTEEEPVDPEPSKEEEADER